MKIALITTTINIPKVLSLYRMHSPNDDGRGVRFFVAGDLKTPKEAYDFCYALGGITCIPAAENSQFKCEKLLGWNTITRRNIALLEALRWGAELIISVDDDNFPLSTTYFQDFANLFTHDFNGLKVGDPKGSWFDAGQWQWPRDGIDPVVQRGFPQDRMSDERIGVTTNAKVGLAQGTILGDPDTSAVDRMSRHPMVHNVSELFQSGFVVDNGTWTVCNTQNTAVLAEFAPALLCCPQFGRYDDIFASLICQRIMCERGYVTHFGKPFVWQQRNPHDLVKDLQAEMFGMEHIVHLATVLDEIPALPKDIHPVRAIYNTLSHVTWFPKGANELAQAFMDDVESVMQARVA
jgi:hypothetical protein